MEVREGERGSIGKEDPRWEWKGARRRAVTDSPEIHHENRAVASYFPTTFRIPEESGFGRSEAEIEHIHLAKFWSNLRFTEK
jgi:hypothetical protein